METNNGNANASDSNEPLYFGNYEAVKAIGKGKFAVVYRAHRVGDDQVVALKRISVDMMNEKAREKCLKEVRLLQSLDHPNIIRYMDSFINDNDLIIIYEWAAAGDLKRQIRKAQEKGIGFEERVVWKYFSQIANAIQHMHERRIMHRDLKPANIFLTLDGTIKVGDLGLSREFSEHTHQAHSKVGTPLYMSPEVIKGVDGYDFKSDIWSLGCLLYELAVLKSPFKSEGINLYSLLHKISNGDYSPIPDHYSEELRNLAHAMISTNPEDRPDILHICDVAQKMRALTANDKNSKLKRSYSRSDDLTNDMTAEIKNEIMKVGPARPDFESKDNGEIDRSRINSNRKSRDEDERSDINPNGITNGTINQTTNLSSLSTISPPNTNEAANRTPRVFEYRNSEVRRETNMDVDERFISEEKKDRDSRIEVPFTPQTYRLPPRTNSSNPFQSNYSPPANPSISPAAKQTTANVNANSLQYQNVSLPADDKSDSPLQQPQAAPAVYRRSKPPRPESANKSNRKSADQSDQTHLSSAPTIRNENQRPTSSNPSNQTAEDNNSNFEQPPSSATTGRKPSVSNFTEMLENASSAFSVMDGVYTKLVLLGYSMYEAQIDPSHLPLKQRAQGRLLPFHFAVNLQIFEKVAGHDNQYQFQLFHRLIEVIQWLCCTKMKNSKAAQIMQQVDLHFNNSITIAKQVILAAQAAGTFSEELSAITPTAILPGYGLNVCLLLNHFADCALKANNFVPQPPIFPEVAQDTFHASAEMEESVEESSEGDGEGDAIDLNSLENQQYDVKEEESDLAFSLSTVDRTATVGSNMEGGGRIQSGRKKNRIIESVAIDPTLWKQETERITPLLKKTEKLFEVSALNSWHGHVSTIQSYCQLVGIRNSQSFESNEKSAAARSQSSSSAKVAVDSLESIRSNLSKDLQNILKSEKLLNSRSSLSSISMNYQSLKMNLNEFHDKSLILHQKIQEQTSRLAETGELLEELQQLLHEKAGTGGKDGKGEAEVNPVIRYKEGIQRLQVEIKDMYIASNFLNHQLLQCRQRQQYSKAEKMRKYRKQRARRSKHSSRREGSGVVSSDEDEEDRN